VSIVDPQSVESTGEVQEDKGPNDGLKDIMQPEGNDRSQQHDNHLDSMEAEQHLAKESQDMAEPTQMNEPQMPEQSKPDGVSGISMGVILKDLPVESTIEVRDVAQAPASQGSTTEHDVLETDAHQSAAALENPQAEAETIHEADLPISKMNVDNEIPLMPKEQGGLGSDSQQSVVALENSQAEAQSSTGADLPILETKSDEGPLTLEHDVLGSNSQESAIHVENTSTEAEATHEVDLPISQMKVDEQVSQMPEQQLLHSEVDKSATLENPVSEVETSREANLPISQLKVDETASIHVKSATSDSNDVGEIDGTLANGVDTGKSTSVDDLSPNGYDSASKLSPRKTATPNIERSLTPSSIRSPVKAAETENFFKAIWRTVFVGWVGGLFASLCGGDRGP
jgi:hypothetical protein